MLSYDMNDGIENLRRVIRLIEEMDAYFAKLESVPLAQGTLSSVPIHD